MRSGWRFVVPALALSVLCRCAQETPQTRASQPSDQKEIRGRILDGDGHPFTKPVIVDVNNVRAQADRSGHFTLRGNLWMDRATVYVAGEMFMYVRPLAQKNSTRYELSIPLTKNAASTNLGTWLAEDNESFVRRVTRDFGPICDAAAAGKPVSVPAEAAPLFLIKNETLLTPGWRDIDHAETMPRSVDAVCVWEKTADAGVYTEKDGGSTSLAERVQWDVVAVRGGRAIAKTTLVENPPAHAPALNGMAATGQKDRLRNRVADWIEHLPR